MHIWIFSTDFHKSTQYQISRQSVQWEPGWYMRVDGRTWRNSWALVATMRTRVLSLHLLRFTAWPIQTNVGFWANIRHYSTVLYDARSVQRIWTSYKRVTQLSSNKMGMRVPGFKPSTPQHTQPPTQSVPGFSARPRRTAAEAWNWPLPSI
jgi:hypothetical protein